MPDDRGKREEDRGKGRGLEISGREKQSKIAFSNAAFNIIYEVDITGFLVGSFGFRN